MQEIVYGIEELENVFSNYKKFFFVHGKSYDKSFLKSYFGMRDCVEFTDFSSNPKYEEVCMGVEAFNNSNCDVIVAIGGGSAIDVAKCIKLYSELDSKKDYFTQELRWVEFPFVAIPTTAGSGSESTRYAVYYFDSIKQSISHECIIPDKVVLIPELLCSLSQYQKKCTMLDAFCQAIESWWSIHSTEESILFSKKAISLIKNNYKSYIYEGKACKEIMEAANLAGKAINITATTAPHAMSYKLTTLYHIPHGHAVSLTLPYVWKYMSEISGKCCDPRGIEYFENTMKEIETQVGLEWFMIFMNEIEMKYPVSKNKAQDVNLLVESVNLTRLKNSPVLLDKDALDEIYSKVIKDEG